MIHTTLNLILNSHVLGRCGLSLISLLCASITHGEDAGAESGAPQAWRYDFGAGQLLPGHQRVTDDLVYDSSTGFGFDLGTKPKMVVREHSDPLQHDLAAGDAPFYFSVHLPEGNYRVAVTFGDVKNASNNTVKAESRRLVLEDVNTQPGEFVTRSFAVNVRTPALSGGGRVGLKTREKNVLHWDEKLTLEFNGSRPAVCGIEIHPADDIKTVYLLGDSTVTDQPREPWNSWGQMLTRFFDDGVAVANHAESGETLKGAIRARRVQKVLECLQPNDYLFVQFGHNDMKDRASDAKDVFRSNLIELIEETRAKDAIPVLVTSMERKNGVRGRTLHGYPQIMRDIALAHDVVLIDLNEMSLELYRALGIKRGRAFQDGTHHNAYGSYELARCIVKGIQETLPALAKNLRKEVTSFDPSHPDSYEAFSVPASSNVDLTPPDGN
ncbi:Rhamnogalacturonan acetylesterase RhgT [Calycomorphotria hydatis]|uniref:Rhamnogalacturonan acetylesterase RhgT n=2 Tax=Calycomorphotria hydatis TaxID=2528027 RepID=A0A517T5F2_9PLAN|nr:Rhamnogalacturonan acetylesterase RhgT [Calycomorphotria hydatis]